MPGTSLFTGIGFYTKVNDIKDAASEAFENAMAAATFATGREAKHLIIRQMSHWSPGGVPGGVCCCTIIVEEMP